MTFKHDHHNKIADILRSLDSDFFWANRSYFGGGTRLSLEHGEYRVSYDIDFLVDGNSYGDFRRAVGGEHIDPLFLQPATPDAYVHLNRDKMLFSINEVKFEVVHENRISLNEPVAMEGFELPCLAPIDQIATKLLANADRWNDQGALSRDLLDLCVLIQVLNSAWGDGFTKAQEARNSNPVRDNLCRAIDHALDNDILQDRITLFSIEDDQFIHRGFELLQSAV